MNLLLLAGTLAFALAGPRPLRLPRRWGVALDWSLALLCAALGGWTAWPSWQALSPRGAPVGPDVEAWLASALAFETGQWSIYADDRWPAWPWLVSLFSPDALSLPGVGTTLACVCTALAAVPVYWTGRQLGGRLAGIAGAILALRQPLALDIGHTFGAYPLLALVDAALLALGLAAARGSRAAAWATVPFAVLAFAADPKQVPLVFASLILASAFTRRPWVFLAGLAGLAGADAATARYRLGLLPLEELVSRTPVRVSRQVSEHTRDGWALGQGWSSFVPSFWRVSVGVWPVGGDATTTEELPYDYNLPHGLAMDLPGLSPLWLLPALRAAPELLLVEVVHLGLQAASLRVQFAHRYAFTALVPAHGVVAGGLGSGAAGFGLVALLTPSPWKNADLSYQQVVDPQVEPWVGAGSALEQDVMRWARVNLPEGTRFWDFSQSRPMPVFAAAFPYARCNIEPCSALLAEGDVAIVWMEDQVSAQLAGQRLTSLPPTLGSCWERISFVQPGSALYRATCDPRGRMQP